MPTTHPDLWWGRDCAFKQWYPFRVPSGTEYPTQLESIQVNFWWVDIWLPHPPRAEMRKAERGSPVLKPWLLAALVVGVVLACRVAVFLLGFA